MKAQEISTHSGGLKEHFTSPQHALISWKSILAGLFVTLILYIMFTALGAGIGGVSVSNAIQEGRSGEGLGLGARLWIGIAALLSLAAGSYFAARTSTFITGRIGAAQGLIIAALFFSLMIYGLGKTIGAAGEGLESIFNAAGVSATRLVSSPLIQNNVERVLGNLKLKDDPSTVAKGLITRLLQGQSDSARSYLSYQTGQSEAQLSLQFYNLENEFKSSLKSVAISTAEAVSQAGWSLFLILLVGIAVAALGGALGSRANFSRPLTDEHLVSHLTAQTIS